MSAGTLERGVPVGVGRGGVGGCCGGMPGGRLGSVGLGGGSSAGSSMSKIGIVVAVCGKPCHFSHRTSRELIMFLVVRFNRR